MVRGKKFNDCVKRDICGAMQEKSMGSLVREGRGGFIFILSGIAPAALCVCPHKRSCRKKASFMKPPFVGPTLEIMVIIGSEFAKIEEEDNIYQSERKTFTHFLTVTSRNPQHDCVKPRGGSSAFYTMCKKHRFWWRMASLRVRGKCRDFSASSHPLSVAVIRSWSRVANPAWL